MRVGIVLNREDDRIITIRELDDCPDRASIAHFMAELDLMKLDLLTIWDEMEADKRVVDI